MTPSNWPAKARATNRSNTFHIHTGPRRAGTSHLNILGVGMNNKCDVELETYSIVSLKIFKWKAACYCKCHIQLFIQVCCFPPFTVLGPANWIFRGQKD